MLKDKEDKLKEQAEALDKQKKAAADNQNELETQLKMAETLVDDWTRRDGELKKQIKAVDDQVEKYDRELLELLQIRTKIESNDADYVEAAQNLLRAAVDMREENRKALRERIDPLLEEFRQGLINTSALEQKIAELDRKQAILEMDRDIFEKDKRDFVQEKIEQYGPQWEVELNRKISQINNLEERLVCCKTMISEKQKELDDISSAFEGASPKEMADIQNNLKKKLETLEAELESRPAQYELDSFQKENLFLKNRVEELQSKVDEGELLELRKLFENQETYALEIHSYKNKLESAEVHKAFLRKKIDDLLKIIDHVRGETEKTALAFNFANDCDRGKGDIKINPFANRPSDDRVPADLGSLITHIRQRMASEKFYYDDPTIRIFLAGLHMSPISILQGISGTGKTSLPREFSKALLSDQRYQGTMAPYRICAVQSGWRDNLDLMGNFNSFENRYNETEFFQALYLANQPKYADILFLIILDEMNLSRPEYYFADFLSKLEQAPEDRDVTIPDTPKQAWPNEIRNGKIKIPENVRFIGTANHDESTLEFAPKTYDRSNLMELPKNHPDPAKESSNSRFDITYSWLKEQFETAEAVQAAKVSEFDTFIKSIRNLFQKQDIGIGNRFEGQARRFISVFCASGGSLAQAAEHLIVSRFLRRLKGRYDLRSDELKEFQTEYRNLFTTQFKEQPLQAEQFFQAEIANKDKQ